MPATCVPQYVPRANTGFSKHGDPVFPHFGPGTTTWLVFAQGGGGGTQSKNSDNELQQTIPAKNAGLLSKFAVVAPGTPRPWWWVVFRGGLGNC